MEQKNSKADFTYKNNIMSTFLQNLNINGHFLISILLLVKRFRADHYLQWILLKLSSKMELNSYITQFCI